MTLVTGAAVTTNVSSRSVAIDLSGAIDYLEPSSQPLAIFSRKAEKKSTIAPKFYWNERGRKARYLTQSGGATNSATTVAVGAGQGSYVQQWDQVLNTRTSEQFRVDGVSGDNLTVTRAIGSTGTAMLNGDELMLIGTAQPENDTSKPARFDVPSEKSNFTQIFRTPYEASDTLRASGSQLSPAEWMRLEKEAGIEHAIDIETTFLHGRKSATTPGATEARTMGGMFSFIATNQTDAGGDLSEAEFNAAMLQGFRYGSKNKLALASGVGVSALNKFPASKQQTRNDETTYGMSVTHYTSPFGSLNLVYHPLLEGTKYGGVILIVDLDNIKYRYLANDGVNRDTKVLQNRQPNDQDGRKDEILSEVSLQVGLERTHALISGITS